MQLVRHRAIFLFVLLALLIAPVANAWCATVCIAAAISGGCAHGLQPTDDLPVDKATPAPAVQWQPYESGSLLVPAPALAPGASVVQRTPLRI